VPETIIIIIIIIIRSLCAIRCIIRAISSRKMSEACGMQERDREIEENSYRVLVATPEGKCSLADVS
jgi:hypothetical protein